MKATKNMMMRLGSWVIQFCYNNAKSWQLGWFADETIEIGIDQQWIGTLKGKINYGNGDNSSKVIIKVKDPNSDVAYYIGFNHQAKHNSDTREAANLVTIQEYPNFAEGELLGGVLSKNIHVFNENMRGNLCCP
jgi:hypothetical protein